MNTRRSARGGRRSPSAPSIETKFRALFQGSSSATRDVWFDASRYNGLISAPTSFIDYNDPTHLLNVTGTLPIAADAAMGNALAAQFSTTQIGTSSRAASDWTFANNTPCTIFCVLKPANTTFAIWWETGAGLSANTAAVISNTAIQAYLYRSSTTNFVNGTAVVANTPRALRFSADDTANPAFSLKVSGQAAVTLASVSGAQAACPGTLTIGARVGLTLGMTANWRSFYAFHRILSPTEIAIVNAKILADCGIAA